MRVATAITAAVLTTTALGACTTATEGRPVSGPHSYPSPPAGTFPDLAAFQVADLAGYSSTNWHDDTQVSFTAAGVTCLANVYGQTTGVDGLGMIDCRAAHMPGFPLMPVAKSCRARRRPGRLSCNLSAKPLMAISNSLSRAAASGARTAHRKSCPPARSSSSTNPGAQPGTTSSPATPPITTAS